MKKSNFSSFSKCPENRTVFLEWISVEIPTSFCFYNWTGNGSHLCRPRRFLARGWSNYFPCQIIFRSTVNLFFLLKVTFHKFKSFKMKWTKKTVGSKWHFPDHLLPSKFGFLRFEIVNSSAKWIANIWIFLPNLDISYAVCSRWGLQGQMTQFVSPLVFGFQNSENNSCKVFVNSKCHRHQRQVWNEQKSHKFRVHILKILVSFIFIWPHLSSNCSFYKWTNLPTHNEEIAMRNR